MRLVSRPVLIVWGALVAITALSWWTTADSGLDREAAGVTILVLAFGKSWLVAWWFMDLRDAPAALRRSVGAVLAVACAGLVALLLLA